MIDQIEENPIKKILPAVLVGGGLIALFVLLTKKARAEEPPPDEVPMKYCEALKKDVPKMEWSEARCSIGYTELQNIVPFLDSAITNYSAAGKTQIDFYRFRLSETFGIWLKPGKQTKDIHALAKWGTILQENCLTYIKSKGMTYNITTLKQL